MSKGPPLTPELKKLQRQLERQKREILAAGADDVTRALKLLAGDSIPDPASYPTRQLRRQAERAARKARRS